MSPPGKRIAPGVYADGDTMHIDAEELCAAAGYDPTPENVATLERAAEQMAASQGLSFEAIPPNENGKGGPPK